MPSEDPVPVNPASPPASVDATSAPIQQTGAAPHRLPPAAGLQPPARWSLPMPGADPTRCVNPACGRPLVGVRAWPIARVRVLQDGAAHWRRYVPMACDECAEAFQPDLAEPGQPLVVPAAPAEAIRT